MQIKYLKIHNFKALKDFEIDFNNKETGDSLAVLVGENGSGKSSVIEAIIRIFGGFFSDKIAEDFNFDFEIKYILSLYHIDLQRKSQQYSIEVMENEISVFSAKGKLATIKTKIQKAPIKLIPKRIISFYSGTHDNLFSIVAQLEKNHLKNLKVDLSEHMKLTLSEEVIGLDSNTKHNNYDKTFVHCTDELLPIYLVTLLCNDNPDDREYLCSALGIKQNFNLEIELDLKSALLVMDRGIVVFDKFVHLIDYILDYDNGKDHFMELIEEICNFNNNRTTVYITLKGDHLKDFSPVTIYKFLERLQEIFKSKMKVFVDGVDCEFFSEGQRQLVKMFGMLSICKNEECLVLMDEPDAHMNPKWRYNIKDYIKTAISGAINTQIIIATHDPLLISGMDSDDIKIFQKTESGTKVFQSNTDTYGMGIDGLLQSEYYGLKTSYDKETSIKYEKRHELYLKLINKDISDEEKIELRELTSEIGSLPVANNTIDFLYDDFMQVFRKTDFYKKEYLEIDQLEERRKKIKEIIASLYEELP